LREYCLLIVRNQSFEEIVFGLSNGSITAYVNCSNQVNVDVRESPLPTLTQKLMKAMKRTISVTTDLFSSLDDIEPDGLESRSTSAGLSKAANVAVNPDLRPIVLLHGITDCHLKNVLDDDNRVWLDYVDLVRGRFSRFLTLQPDGKSDQAGTLFETDGPLWKKYRTAIRTWQEEGFDANVFCYDWRRSVVDASQMLHQHLVSHNAVSQGKKAILVCHSMGGVVASYWAATHPDWEKFVERCVFVGSPLAGAYSPAQAIMGLSPSFKKMALLSIKESMKDFQRMAASFPGLVDLLPNPEVFPEAVDLYQRDGWPGNFFPQQKLLDQSCAVKSIVWNSPLFGKSIHLISTGLRTLAEMPWDALTESRSDDVLSLEGDGSVLNRSSTPAGLKAYLVPGEHSMLLNEMDVINSVMAVARGESISLPEYRPNLASILQVPNVQPELVAMKPPAPVYGKVDQAIDQFASDDMKNAMRGIRTVSSTHSFSRPELNNKDFSWQNCYSLALASQLAYQKDENEISSVATGVWGFPFAKPFDEEDTQGVVLSDDDVVVLAFRGSEANIGDWLGNLSVAATDTTIGRVHSGFWNAFKDAEDAIHLLLEECRADQKALWICGHSLGGALAVIAGAMLYKTHKISSVCTYGQPKLCVNKLDDIYYDNLTDRYVRIVNDEDVVAKVPPGYSHFGQLRWFAHDGSLKSSRSLVAGGSPVGLAAPIGVPDELNQQEFDDLQEMLRKSSEENKAGPAGLTLPRGLPTQALFGISFADHSLADGYIPAIEKQF
jgi:pimeloyl-ACP methyl ester carboxylesterase